MEIFEMSLVFRNLISFTYLMFKYPITTILYKSVLQNIKTLEDNASEQIKYLSMNNKQS